MKQIKSKDMFAARFRPMLNYGTDPDTEREPQSPYLNKLDSVQSILSFTEQDAKELLSGLPGKELEPGQDFI